MLLHVLSVLNEGVLLLLVLLVHHLLCYVPSTGLQCGQRLFVSGLNTNHFAVAAVVVRSKLRVGQVLGIVLNLSLLVDRDLS